MVLHNANYSFRRLDVPNELIRQVARRHDLLHLKPENQPTGAAALRSWVRSCDPTIKCIDFITLAYDWVIS